MVAKNVRSLETVEILNGLVVQMEALRRVTGRKLKDKKAAYVLLKKVANSLKEKDDRQMLQSIISGDSDWPTVKEFDSYDHLLKSLVSDLGITLELADRIIEAGYTYYLARKSWKKYSKSKIREA